MENKRCALRWLVLLSWVSMSSLVVGAEFRAGDEVELTRETPLFFLDKIHRDGIAGEKFKVAAYKAESKKVFLLFAENGRDIALSVDEGAVKLVLEDTGETAKKVRKAAETLDFASARDLLRRALRANPVEPRLIQVANALERSEIALRRTGTSKASLSKAQAEAARIRKNADVTDRPNLLFPDDNSNQQRAQRMREQADAVENRAKEALQEAEADFKQTLNGIADPAEVAEKPGLPADRKDLEKWTKDEESIPPIIDGDNEKMAAYKDTLEFINNKLTGSWKKVWFGKNTGAMIIVGDLGVAILDPAELSPHIKYNPVPLATARGPQFTVRVEGRNGRKVVAMHLTKTSEVAQISTLVFGTSDPVDQKKMVNAFSTLIQMLGGKPDAFAEDDK